MSTRPAKPVSPGTAIDRPASRAAEGRAHLRRALLLVGTDAVSLVASFVATVGVAALAGFSLPDIGPLVGACVGAVAFWLLTFLCYGLYTRPTVRIATVSVEGSVRDAFAPLVTGSLILLIFATPLNSLVGGSVFGPSQTAVFLSAALVAIAATRVVARSVAPAVAWQPTRTLIVGSGMVASLMATKIQAHQGYGIELVGYIDDDPEGSQEAPGGLPLLGMNEDIADVVEEHDIDHVIVAFSRAGHEEMLSLVREVRNPAVQVSIVPRYFEVFPAHAMIDDLEGVPVITLPPVRLGFGARFVKRAFDLIVASILLVLLIIPMLIIAAAIRIDSAGPVIFRQDRRGRGGSVFRIAKFRSMRVGAEAERMKMAAMNEVDGPLFKVDKDPRITNIGGFLRKTSLDELPQLWNVLTGDMSLVGPRPFVLHEADQITGWANRRLDVAPGVTGLWQAMGRNDLSYEEMIKLDYLYVTNWSLWWDIKIIGRTAHSVLSRDGAY